MNVSLDIVSLGGKTTIHHKKYLKINAFFSEMEAGNEHAILLLSVEKF